jgi:hypothetical protein
MHGCVISVMISVSQRLAPYIEQAFILSPDNSEGDHSTIGIDFNFGSLTNNANLSGVDPGHVENQTLVSTDVKASMSYLDKVKKKNVSHNVTARMQRLYEHCECTGHCTKDDIHQYQEIRKVPYSNAKQSKKECMLASARQMVQYANEEF